MPQTTGEVAMVTRSEMVERWLQYCATKTDRHDIFLAGIGLLNDGDNAQYYATVGLDSLLQAAHAEIDGPENHPAWPCGVKPVKL